MNTNRCTLRCPLVLASLWASKRHTGRPRDQEGEQRCVSPAGTEDPVPCIPHPHTKFIL